MALEQKVQSLQHSVLFLQEQHSLTLNGLHAELEKLQKKCSDLTFKNSLSQLDTFATEQDESNSLKEQFESEIRTLRKDNLEYKKLIEAKDKRLKLLEGQLKSKEQKYNDDIRNIQRIVAELQLELENKSSSIAYLTAQLQKQKLSDNNAYNEQQERGLSFSPSPPRGGTPSKRNNIRRRTVISPSPAANVTGLIEQNSSHQLHASDHVLEHSLPKNNSSRFSTRYKQSIADPPRPAIGHSQIKRERDLRLNNKVKSDYEDFIRLSESSEVVTKASVEPLPPITTRSGRQLREKEPPNAKFNRKAATRLLRSNKATASSTGGVETIIVENQLKSPERQYVSGLHNSSSK